MLNIIESHKEEFDKVIEFLNVELSGLRTGRANSALVENLPVDAYGSRMPLNQMASISVPDAKTIMIEPWDKSILKDIERAIANSGLGVNPYNSGSSLRLTIPALTEETRKNLIKVLSQKLEVARVGIRMVREKVRDQIQKAEKDGDIAEDDKYNLQKKLDDMAGDYNLVVKTIGEKKEEEIMTI